MLDKYFATLYVPIHCRALQGTFVLWLRRLIDVDALLMQPGVQQEEKNFLVARYGGSLNQAKTYMLALQNSWMYKLKRNL